MKIGDTIYFLYDYVLERGTVIGIGPVNVRVQFGSGHITRQTHAKCAMPDESIAVVWELHKGRNGRGGYRLERELYADQRVPAKDWSYQTYVYEKVAP